mmetsp:Transcript_55371/g.177619  ORF Transcript_55371/g.177619 Transcript_55371/m.177619 type:complete len:202 (-) Transcript_55371:1583-2188(-)
MVRCTTACKIVGQDVRRTRKAGGKPSSARFVRGHSSSRRPQAQTAASLGCRRGCGALPTRQEGLRGAVALDVAAVAGLIQNALAARLQGQLLHEQVLSLLDDPAVPGVQQPQRHALAELSVALPELVEGLHSRVVAHVAGLEDQMHLLWVALGVKEVKEARSRPEEEHSVNVVEFHPRPVFRVRLHARRDADELRRLVDIQ